MKAAVLLLPLILLGPAPVPAKRERLQIVSRITISADSSHRGTLTSASIIRDNETGREWFVVDAAAGAIVPHVQELGR